jgi:radical SAM protein (TIGR01212 family)
MTAIHQGEQLYRPVSSYWKQRYGERVQKISLDAGFTCPNRDGTKAVGGCIYCNNDSFNFSPAVSIREQLIAGIQAGHKRYGAKKFVAYFQAYTNTYAPADQLESLYGAIFEFPEIVGLSIGTRPDCVPDEVLDVIQRFSKLYEVWVEYGLESSSDDTLRRINRAHTFADFSDAVLRTQGRGIKIATHIIVGFPWESTEVMMQTAHDILALPIDAIKIHNLHIVKGTALEVLHTRSPFRLMSMEEYIQIAAKILELLSPEMLILRLSADCPADLLVAPTWCNEKMKIVDGIVQELQSRNSYQGRLYSRPAI